MAAAAKGGLYCQKTGGSAALSQIVFDQYCDEDGRMEVGHLKELCEDKGFDIDETEIEAAFVRLDNDASGFIEYEEFLAWWKTQEMGSTRTSGLRYRSEEEKEIVGRAKKSFAVGCEGQLFMTPEQFRLKCYTKGFCLTDAELHEVFSALDKSGDGYIDFTEYYRWWSSDDRFTHLQHDENDEVSCYIQTVGEFFRAYDPDLTGYLGIEQFTPLFDSLVEAGEVDRSLEEVIAEVDANGDGRISLNEFLKWYTSNDEEE
eukprot:TRINITY_DN67649_c0_g1_i1.p1 TRINITY_DN67649_c0_g1~~TRINITY_DN67649_c0_g1_i1.p1  ORF type:complete len:259 (-),score=59.52 TRINITY_DN67649_c0_g1_i1:143-919(-)